MSILLVGLNHKSAPLGVRERLAFSELECSESLRQLVDGKRITEGLIVSTCNRVEVLTAIPASEETGAASETVSRFLSESRGVGNSFFDRHLYTHVDDVAVRHMFRVASSLDSMVIGEPQVLGQIRRAYSVAVEAGVVGRVLNRLMHHTLRVAKRVRTETGLGANAVSISYMAVELAKKVFGSLGGHTVLMVGAGEMAELAARHLINAGAGRLLITNRTAETATAMAARFEAETVPYERFPSQLYRADIVICSTSAPGFVITPEMAREAMESRRSRPALFVDISVPRNVDPSAGGINNLFVFDVDDLEAVVASNIREREREAQRAELIVEAEVMGFQQALRALELGPTIGALRKRLQDIARSEFERHRGRLGPLSPEQERAIESLLIATANKIAHPVMTGLRQSRDPGTDDNLQAWRELVDAED